MKNSYSVILVFSLILCFTGSCKQKKNKEVHKNEIIVESAEYLISGTLWVQRSAEYRANCYQAFNLARIALENNLKTVGKDKPAAVVLDIDETVLDNSYFQANLVENNSPYSSHLWKEWTDKKLATATPGAIEFLEFAQSIGVEIVYISNRKVDELDATIENMRQLGFPEIKIENALFKTTESSKNTRRSEIEKRYNIILLVGDNLADFDGIFEDRSDNYGFDVVDKNKEMFGQKYIILPNPMYGNWEDVLKNDRKGSLISYSKMTVKEIN